MKFAKIVFLRDRSGTIEVTLDTDAIAKQLALKAFHNKSGKTRYMHGAIVGKSSAVRVG